MKDFNDLQFNDHPLAAHYEGAKHATMTFENNYGVSVVFGSCFYSNGVDTYELAVLKNGKLCYNTEITDDVEGHISKDEVSRLMALVQKL